MLCDSQFQEHQSTHFEVSKYCNHLMESNHRAKFDLRLSNLTAFCARSDPLQYIQASATQLLTISCLCERGRCVACLRVSGKDIWGVEAIYNTCSRIHTHCRKCMGKELA